MSEIARDESGKSQSLKTGRPDPYGIAAGMLWNDRALLIPLALFLAISMALDLALKSYDASSWTLVAIVDRFLQIAVVAFIALRWRRRLQAQNANSLSGIRLAARIAPVSIASSFLLIAPFIGFALNPGGITNFLFVVLGTLGIVWSLRVYFYFAVVAFMGSLAKPSLARAVAMAKADGTAALRTLVAPCALTMLLTALFTLPSPSGSSLLWMSIASAAECVFWILSTYTAIGYALTAFGDSEWRAAGLTPYRSERLSTLQAQGGARLARYLTPRFGLGLSLLALTLMIANLGRQFSEPPAARVEIKRVEISDYLIKLELEVEDRQYLFRGFHPVGFSVKTQTGFAAVNSLASVSLTADGTGFVGSLTSKDGSPQTIFLTFSSGKTAAALKGLDNLWLWYQARPLLAISSEMLRGKAESDQVDEREV
jgi:hypothetical protein